VAEVKGDLTRHPSPPQSGRSEADPLARTRRARWWIITVPAVLYFVSYFHRIAPVVVAQDLMRAFSVSAASLGQLSAVYPYCFAAMALPGGSLADTLGPRRTLSLGALTMSAGAILFGLAPRFGAAFAGRLLVGLGASVILIASLRLCAEWFRTDEFATVSGWSQSVGSLGALVGTTPMALLVERIGWRQSFVSIGITTLTLAILCVLIVRDRPEALGLEPINPGRPPVSPGLRAVLSGIPKVTGNWRSWPPVLSSTGIYGAFVAFVGLWGVPYLIQVYGLPRVRASNLIAMAAVGLLVGAPLIGWLSDRVLNRRRGPLVAAAGLYVSVWAALVLPARPVSLEWLGPLCFLLGFGSGAVVLVFACVREVNDPRYVGVAIGFHNLPVFLGFALLQWLTGVILDARWTGELAAGARVYSLDAYRAAFTLCLAVSMAALLMACLVTETRCRSIWTPAAVPTPGS
jgi:sugar phosphate permease